MLERWKNKIQADGDCLLWVAARGYNGYGKTFWNGRVEWAHRAVWEFHNGPIPAGLVVCHSCDVRNCVNIQHLWLGTLKDNNEDMKKKGRAGYGGSLFSPDDVRFIRWAAADVPRRVLAEWFGCSIANIGFILSGRSWFRVKGGWGAAD